MAIREYDFGGVKYVQKPLVLGQLKQVLDILKGLELNPDANALQLVEMFGDKVATVLAIILIKDGTTNLKDRDIDALAEELRFNIDLEQAAQVIEDFFELMPVNLLLDKVTGITSKWVKRMEGIGLNPLAYSSPEATLPNATP